LSAADRNMNFIKRSLSSDVVIPAQAEIQLRVYGFPL